MGLGSDCEWIFRLWEQRYRSFFSDANETGVAACQRALAIAQVPLKGKKMTATEIRVLVVDDSAVIRSIISDSIGHTAGMTVVGTAGDGETALQMVEKLTPDVITLDIQMPKMDGLATLDAILTRRPTPVIMVSSLTKLGAQITLDALERGAIDYLAKPDYGEKTKAILREELPRKIRSAAGCDVQRVLSIRSERKARRPRVSAPAPEIPRSTSQDELRFGDKCIVIGVSTGGPPALSRLFESLRPPLPPIVIVQHMPSGFTKSLAWRLDSLSELFVCEAEGGEQLKPNQAYLAPGGRHMLLRRAGSCVTTVLQDGDNVSGHKPSVDVLMRSAAQIYGPHCIGVIMTGMGRDGASGCASIRAQGGYVFGQDEATSDVYGMNKVAFVEGHVDRQFPLTQAAEILTRECRKRWLHGVRA